MSDQKSYGFLNFYGLGFGFYNGVRINKVEPGTKITDPLTQETAVVEDGGGVLLADQLYVTPTTYETLKEKIDEQMPEAAHG
ncbi:hypothetical protein [Chenggangzhangella methanolivorans]|uniref:Uncharacterized protein n=1 Tax=Chenggangzhangella methanolivorans TaxID=1437009 RepID=A0A9E6R7Q8_9HYPH|nr:hypothetical protein [Chenggangzhangella methanolivorans]QZN99752.1 hypothetical protein K6K41_24310 [Chenggangzhangella methanolivorans]